MRFRVPVKAFHPAYSAALAAASKSSPQPIMKHVLCRVAAEGTVTLEGTDGHRGVIARVQGVEVVAEGAVIFDGQKVDGILRANADSVLDVEATEVAVVVRCEEDVKGRKQVSRHSLAVFPPDQFPSIASNIEQARLSASLPVNDLLTLFRRVKFAASDDVADEKNKSRGVMFRADGGRVEVAGIQPTLSIAAGASCAAQVAAPTSLMVPANALTLLASVLPKSDGTAEVRTTTVGLAVVTGDCEAWVTAMASNLPAVHKLFPTADHPPACRWADAQPFFTAVERAMVTTSDESVRGFFTFGPGGGVVRTSAPDKGESEVPFDLPDFAGEAVEVPFNTQAVRKIEGGLRKEDQVSAALHLMGKFLRLVVRYGTPEAGGQAVLVQMTVAD